MADNFFKESEEKKALKKEDIFIRAQRKMNDTQFLKNVRTSLILFIIVGVPILYFGFFENISLDALMSWNLGGLAIMSIALVTLLRIDTKSRAFDDEINNNEELSKTELCIIEENDKISDHALGRRFIKEYNKAQHKIEDEKATDKVIDRYNLKITALQVKGKEDSKRYKALQKKLAEVKIKGVRGKFKDINYEDLYNANGKAAKSGRGPKSDLTYNPKKESIIGNLVGIFFKGFGIGAAGSIPFLFHASVKTIIIYYLTLFTACAITVVQTYIKMRFKMSRKYLGTRKFRLHMLKLCNQFIAANKDGGNEKPMPVVDKPEEMEEENKQAFPITRSVADNVSGPLAIKIIGGAVSHLIK